MTVGIGFGTCREFVCYSEQEKKAKETNKHKPVSTHYMATAYFPVYLFV